LAGVGKGLGGHHWVARGAAVRVRASLAECQCGALRIDAAWDFVVVGYWWGDAWRVRMTKGERRQQAFERACDKKKRCMCVCVCDMCTSECNVRV
jgi:hypothetical protein